jgi:FlaG/FlaF family flagellin (archaellin)
VPGAVLIVIAMVLVVPVAVMLAGAIWSALVGWVLTGDADQRAESRPS